MSSFQNTRNFPLIIERLNHELPKEFNWWPLWTDGLSMPSFLTAVRVGIFEAVLADALSVDTLAKMVDISVRSARVFLDKMVALRLLQRDIDNNTFSCSQSYLEIHRHPKFSTWISLLAKYPMTTEKYISVLTGKNVDSDVLALAEEPLLQNILSKCLSCVTLGVADEINLFSALPSSRHNLMQHIKGTLGEISETAVDRFFLQTLTTMDVIELKDNELFSLQSWASPFVDKTSPFYKGALIQLMMRNEPPSPEQSWNALEAERVRLGRMQKVSIEDIEEKAINTETLMDQSTIQAENRAHEFALHMDAQGVGQDVVVARTAFAPGDRVLDLAGGGGSYSILGAAVHAHTHFRILEYRAMTAVAQQWVAHYQASGALLGQVDVAEGDMFSATCWESLKEDFRPNKIFLSNVFHDWSLETDLKLATFAFHALPSSGGQMILHEMPLEELSSLGSGDVKEGNAYEKSIAVGFSECLRIWTEGTQYRRSEIVAVLTAAGFGQVDILDGYGQGPYCIFIATKGDR